MTTQDVVIRNKVKSLCDEFSGPAEEFSLCLREHEDTIKNPLSNFINVNSKSVYAVPEKVISDVFGKYEKQVKENVSMHMAEVINDDSCMTLSYAVQNPDKQYTLDVNELCINLGETLYDDLELLERECYMAFYKHASIFASSRTKGSTDYLHRYTIKIFLRTSPVYISYFCKKYTKDLTTVKPVVQAYLHGSYPYGESKPELINVKSFKCTVNENTGRTSTRVTDVSVAIVDAHELSINYTKNIIPKPHCTPNDDLETELSGLVSEELTALSSKIDIKRFGSQYEAEYIREMLQHLDIAGLNKYETNIILLTLRSLDVSYKKLAIEWLMRNDVWDKAQFKEIWNKRIDTKSYSLGIICYYLKRQDEVVYKSIRENTALAQCMRFLRQDGGQLTDSSRAELVKNLWGHMYKTGALQVTKTRTEKVLCRLNIDKLHGRHRNKDRLYKWQINCDNSHLIEVIEKDLTELVSRARSCFALNKEPNNAKEWEKFLKKVSATKTGMGNLGLINRTELFFRTKVYEECFLDDMDKDPKFIGCLNGILDLRGEKPILIKEVHPFKISKTCNAYYTPYDPENKYIKRLEEVFRSIIPEKCAYEEIMMICSSCLYPVTPMMFLMQLYGGGANGKSTLVEMLSEMLGEYSQKGKSNVFTGRRTDASGPDSQLVSYENQRLVSFSESNAGEVLNDGQFKEIINNEKIAPRGLYQSEHKGFQVIARFLYTSNNPFIINTTDNGTWRRIRVYRAKKKYTSNPDPNNPWEELADSRIEHYKNKQKYLDAFLSIMVEYVMKFKNEFKCNFDAIRSPVINSDTELYQISQNKILQFLQTKVLRIKDPMAQTNDANQRNQPYTLSEIVAIYAEWYKNTHGKALNMPFNIIETQFESSALSKYMYKDVDTGTSLLSEMEYRIIEANHFRLTDNEEYLFKKDLQLSKFASSRPTVAVTSKKIKIDGKLLDDKLLDGKMDIPAAAATN
tara:strand:- start:50033 stop:52936 length:2904 start_codon:yes stop_codon:yes gene_type:complete